MYPLVRTDDLAYVHLVDSVDAESSLWCRDLCLVRARVQGDAFNVSNATGNVTTSLLHAIPRSTIYSHACISISSVPTLEHATTAY